MPSTEPTAMSPGLILRVSNASVTSFEKLADQKTWFNVKVVTVDHASFHIFRKFEDFVHFSQQLQDIYFNSSTKTALPRIKTTHRINILPTTTLKKRHIQAQRAEELNHFLKCLLKQSPHITDSKLVREFFNLNDKEAVIRYDKLNDTSNNSSRWKRLRCTSFLARSPPSASSATNLSSLCSQAANRIMPWNKSTSNATPQPSMSTPIISKPSSGRKPTLKKSKSNLSMLAETPHPLDSTISLPTPPPSTITSNTNHSSVSCSSSHSDSKTTIKIKVIYDSDNIIVIQVPRSIPFSELRTRIAQKFSEPMKKLLFLDTISSISSTATLDVPTVLINDEQDLSRLMHTKWNKLEKVTLKCTL